MKGIKQITNYLLLKVIGQGATATVYQGLNIKTSTLVAIKAISTLKLDKSTSFLSFQKEINLIKDLNHPNIIQVLGKEKTTNNIYIILEYVNGGNLFDYLSQTLKTTSYPFSEVHVQKIIRQLISGLEYLHQKNIIHRDIKLENILINFSKYSNILGKGKDPIILDIGLTTLDHDFTIKIADFGFARELQNGCVAHTICGTPITMAPDIFTNQQYNSRVDLWSLGAITYELIVGRPPFYSTNSRQLFQEINKGKYSFPQQLRTSIEAIGFINKLLQFNPDNRMNWDDIKTHPFIVNDVKTFHSIELSHKELFNPSSNSIEELELNVKNCDNYLWLTYKDKNQIGISLDKIQNKIEIDNEYITSQKKNSVIKENKENYNTVDINMNSTHKDDKWEIISQSIAIQNTTNDFVVINYDN